MQPSIHNRAGTPRRGIDISRFLVRFLTPDLVFLLAGLFLAVGLRAAFLDFKSLDYYASLKPWYLAIRNEGFAVFATSFSTYNPPYLYILYLVARLLPDLPIEVAVKLPSVTSDFACAYVMFRLVRSQAPERHYLPYSAGFIVLFTPTVVLNSAFWGQADSIFTTGILACVFFLGIRRPYLAVVAFGVALAFKLQAIFLLPLLLALAVRGQIPWKALIAIPVLLLLALLPSWLAGRPLGELLGVYLYQASQFESITMNAPSIYALVPDTRRVFNLLYAPGILLGAAVALVWFTLLRRSRLLIEGQLLAEVALVSMLVLPIFLPKMHERYFFPADLLTIAVACLEPGLFWVPIVAVGVSFLAYQPFLFERSYVPLPILALVLTGLTAFLTFRVVSRMYAAESAKATSPDEPSLAVLDDGDKGNDSR